MPQAATWTFEGRQYGQSRSGRLVAAWEVSYDPISDDYTPDDITAAALLQKWVVQVRAKYPNGLIPIYWFVQGEDSGTFENMPLQFQHLPGIHENFLTYFSQPVNAQTGEPLNWLTLPVRDKLWNAKQANKGGFIQEATGWKPSALQPFVYLPSLVGTAV